MLSHIPYGHIITQESLAANGNHSVKHKIVRHKVAKAHRNKKLVRLYKPPISAELLLKSFFKILCYSGFYFVPL